jgi:hypothetical protein
MTAMSQIVSVDEGISKALPSAINGTPIKLALNSS